MEGTVEMKANLTPQEKQSMITMVQTLDDKTLGILWKTITTNSGGISGMDPDLLKVFYEEFKKRPGLLESLSESKKRNKMKLTESQARRAIRKWLFEFATDSGVSHRASTDDKIAGKLGDDREDQPSSTIPQEIPIIATTQMSTQLTVDMPPIEDPDFIPGTVQELGRSVDLLSQQIPHEEIAWFYDKMQKLADEAILKGSTADLTPLGDSTDGPIEDVIRPSQKASQEAAEATNESWNRWSRMLGKTLKEARKGSKNDPLNLRRRKLSRHDMKPYRPNDDDDWMSMADSTGDGKSDKEGMAAVTGRSPVDMEGEVVGGEYLPTQDEMEMMADELGMELDELPGFDPRRHITPEERQANLASGNFDGEAKLRELVAMGIYPSVRTLSGMKKKIAAEIDPLVQIYATARPAFDWLTGWLEDDFQLSWNGKQIAGPDVYQMAIDAYQKFNKANQAKLDQLADAIETGGFYKEAMAEIVLAPVIRKWVQEVKAGNMDVSSSRSRNNFVMSDWILETVLNSGFGKSGNKRRAAKLDNAMQGMNEFKQAMQVAMTNEPMEDAGDDS